MKVRIFADVGSDRFGSPHQAFVGEGDTFEAARENAIAKVAAILREHSYDASVEVAPGCWLPPSLAAKLPAMPTPEHTLVVYVSCGHSGGELYNWRLTAILQGKMATQLNNGEPRRVGKDPILFHISDSNSTYSIELPEGSFEHVGDEWVPCTALHYDY